MHLIKMQDPWQGNKEPLQAQEARAWLGQGSTEQEQDVVRWPLSWVPLKGDLDNGQVSHWL